MKRIGITALVALVAFASMAPAQDEAKEDKKPAATQPVDYKKLKELLPEKLGDLKRSNLSGQRMKTGEFSMSTAQADYRGEGDDAPSIELAVIDYGAAKGMAEGFAAMTSVEIDQESDEQVQKSVKVEGQPGIETYEKKDQSGQLQLYVGGRYLLSLTTRKLTQEQFEKVMQALPVKKLAALK